ncbi:glutamyl-tRNA synthetase [Lentilactobacillus farraginis DSM 18382 = JCM 14108]|nr:glutamyl-tRNA synthetase [Lentilactobacillus farraginis DSM 18382 = JCM 14108]
MNAEYIRKDTIDDLVSKITELISEGETDIAKKLQKLSLTNLKEFIYQVTKIYQNESYKLTDIMKRVDFYANVCDHKMGLNQLDKLPKDDTLAVLNTLSDKIKKLRDSPDDEVDFRKMIDMVSAETGVSGRKLYFPLNISFTGNQSAPQINEIMNLYSYSTILKLLDNSIKYLQGSSVQYS